MNTFGNSLRLTTFGESHGPAIGGILDGFPSGIRIDFSIIRELLQRRRPGSGLNVSARKEADNPEFLSGISSEGISLGTPIGFIIRNTDARSQDYSDLSGIYRPNHADYTYECRYALRDPRGGGRASARDTANWVVGGGIALSLLKLYQIEITSRILGIGGVNSSKEEMEARIEEARKDGDSVGGIVEVTATGVPAGIGNPLFNKLHAEIAYALMSINGVKGVEYGDGFEAAEMTGSRHSDSFYSDNNAVFCHSNHSGGIQGGISNGMPIVFRVAFKPTPTIAQPLETIDRDGNKCILKAKGRHDPCIALRGAVVTEAMMALSIADQLISSRFFTENSAR